MGLLRSELFKPTLFVGLGGNGGKIINQLAGRLRRHPHWDRIKALTHFLAIDTNKGDLDTLRDVSPDCRFLISNFDARAYVDRKRGRQELHETLTLACEGTGPCPQTIGAVLVVEPIVLMAAVPHE